MGYRTQDVPVTRHEQRDVGATCDRCGKELTLHTIGRGPMFGAELRVRPDILFMRCGVTVEPILYCNSCFAEVLAALPEIQAAMDRANGEGAPD